MLTANLEEMITGSSVLGEETEARAHVLFSCAWSSGPGWCPVLMHLVQRPGPVSRSNAPGPAARAGVLFSCARCRAAGAR